VVVQVKNVGVVVGWGKRETAKKIGAPEKGNVSTFRQIKRI
jgi:hypothetical protein